MAASSSNAGCSRVKNTASVKDLKKCFRLHIKEDHLDVRSFREDEDVVIKKYEQLLLDILDQTLRPTEGVLRSAILEAYEISNKDATACARALHGCFKHCRSKLQSTTSGKRLDPATFRIVQRIKELQGPKASPASNTSSPRGSASSLAISPSPAKPKKLLFVESPTLRVKGKQSGSSADIFALYGLPKPAPNPADSTGAGSRCPRAAISVDDEEDLEVDSAESQGGTILGSSEEEAAAAAARSIPEQHPYFDAAQGCYVKLLAGGETVRGELLPGPEGMCLVKFPGEPEFQSQVPNLFLETNKDKPKSRLKRARGGADKGAVLPRRSRRSHRQQSSWQRTWPRKLRKRPRSRRPAKKKKKTERKLRLRCRIPMPLSRPKLQSSRREIWRSYRSCGSKDVEWLRHQRDPRVIPATSRGQGQTQLHSSFGR